VTEPIIQAIAPPLDRRSLALVNRKLHQISTENYVTHEAMPGMPATAASHMDVAKAQHKVRRLDQVGSTRVKRHAEALIDKDLRALPPQVQGPLLLETANTLLKRHPGTIAAVTPAIKQANQSLPNEHRVNLDGPLNLPRLHSDDAQLIQDLVGTLTDLPEAQAKEIKEMLIDTGRWLALEKTSGMPTNLAQLIALPTSRLNGACCNISIQRRALSGPKLALLRDSLDRLQSFHLRELTARIADDPGTVAACLQGLDEWLRGQDGPCTSLSDLVLASDGQRQEILGEFVDTQTDNPRVPKEVWRGSGVPLFEAYIRSAQAATEMSAIEAWTQQCLGQDNANAPRVLDDVEQWLKNNPAEGRPLGKFDLMRASPETRQAVGQALAAEMETMVEDSFIEEDLERALADLKRTTRQTLPAKLSSLSPLGYLESDTHRVAEAFGNHLATSNKNLFNHWLDPALEQNQLRNKFLLYTKKNIFLPEVLHPPAPTPNRRAVLDRHLDAVASRYEVVRRERIPQLATREGRNMSAYCLAMIDNWSQGQAGIKGWADSIHHTDRIARWIMETVPANQIPPGLIREQFRDYAIEHLQQQCAVLEETSLREVVETAMPELQANWMHQALAARTGNEVLALLGGNPADLKEFLQLLTPMEADRALSQLARVAMATLEGNDLQRAKDMLAAATQGRAAPDDVATLLQQP
jgi:hypothetical protein